VRPLLELADIPTYESHDIVIFKIVDSLQDVTAVPNCAIKLQRLGLNSIYTCAPALRLQKSIGRGLSRYRRKGKKSSQCCAYVCASYVYNLIEVAVEGVGPPWPGPKRSDFLSLDLLLVLLATTDAAKALLQRGTHTLASSVASSNA
jgi:hypothetical protein